MSETANCSDAVIRVMDASDWMAEILNKVQLDSADATRLSIIQQYMHKELSVLLDSIGRDGSEKPGKGAAFDENPGQEVTE